MMMGTVQNVVVCVAATSADSAQQSVCPPNGSQYFQPQTMQAYVLDPSAQTQLDAPFDYTLAAGFWSLAFCTVVGLYLVSHSVGTVLGFIRRG